jgi:enoyl-CoA hydratase/carnithine racemase
MEYQQILTEKIDRVGVIKLNRPDRRNAVSDEMRWEVRDAVDAFNANPAIGAMVFTGVDPAFCGGADVGDWKRNLDAESSETRAPRRSLNWVEMFSTAKPAVCAVNGASIGMGLTITLACDARIASDRARFSMRFIRMGMVPELASTKLLPLIVGFSRALELMLTGKTIDAKEAERITGQPHSAARETDG